MLQKFCLLAVIALAPLAEFTPFTAHPQTDQSAVAIALAGGAHEAQSVERPIVEPNLPLALFIGLGLDADRAERQRGLDGRERLGGYGDLDHTAVTS